MKKWRWLMVSFLAIALDQWSKYWASQALLPYQAKPLLPMLNLTLAYNSGAAFSMLSHMGAWHRWLFAGFSTLMSVVLFIVMYRTPSHKRMQLLALSLILGGAVGNLIDRVSYGFVIDFIDVYYKHYHWPIFNIADSAICLGAFLLFIDLCRSPKQ